MSYELFNIISVAENDRLAAEGDHRVTDRWMDRYVYECNMHIDFLYQLFSLQKIEMMLWMWLTLRAMSKECMRMITAAFRYNSR